MKNIIMIVLACLLAGCAHFKDLPSTCDDIALGESVLCDIAEDKNIRLEDVGNAFIIVNAIAIGEGVYTRQEALVVFETLRDILDDPITYLVFRDSLIDRINRYPGLLDVAMSYLGAFDLDMEIYKTDRDLLISWLDDRIKGLGG